MDKPQKIVKTVEYYDYNQCAKYISEKLGRDINDYDTKFLIKNRRPTKVDESADFKCFWHWVIEKYDVHNGSEFFFSEDELEFIEKDWVKEIYAAFLEEFAENGEIEFYVWW